MMGNRKIFLLFVMAFLSLSAGMVVGWVWTPLQKIEAGSQGTHGGGGPGPWFAQLGLSPDQQKQMDKIWGDTRAQMQKMFERHRELDKERDQEIMALLNPSQRAAYDKINQEFRNGREDADKQRDSLLADANARSRALLDDSQKEKWDILSKDMRRRRGPMGGMSPQHSTTMPSHGEAFEGEGHHD
jgi:Spy/CpxP family protein refolding chaperone